MAFVSSMVAVIECPDGTTYCQDINDDFYDLLDLKIMLGDDYWIVDLFD